MGAAGLNAPLRFWNYLTAITEDDRAWSDICALTSVATSTRRPPPTTGPAFRQRRRGGNQGNSIIYFLAGRVPTITIENQRQVSAYDYPPVYGPSSPSFSRASI